MTPTLSSPLVIVASTIGNDNANTNAATTIMRRAYMGGDGEMKSRHENAKQDDAIAMREQALGQGPSEVRCYHGKARSPPPH